MSRQFSTALWTFAVAIIVLLIANGSPTTGWAGDTSMFILGLTFIASMVAMAFASTNDRMQLSLQLMTIYFSIYLLLPGYNHASLNLFPFYGFSYSPDVRASAALMVMIFMVAVGIGYIATSKLYINSSNSIPTNTIGRYVQDNKALATILTIISIVSMVAFIREVGFSAAFGSRETLDSVTGDSSTAVFTVALPRALTFLPLIYGTLLTKFGHSKRLGVIILMINAPIFLIVNFPLSLARSQSFGILILFILLIFDFKKVSLRSILSIGYVFGALVAMPVLNHFSRRGGTLADLNLRQVTSSYFESGDFDGYQSVANSIVYVATYGYQNGVQLLSALLFFIPRSIWPGKGEPTGKMTAEAVGYDFTNISQPLPSEFYVDFGWAGVIIGGLVLGVFFYRLDRWIDRTWTIDLRTRLAAGWLMGFGITIFRGTLLGVLPPFIIVAFGLWAIAHWGMRPVRYGENADELPSPV